MADEWDAFPAAPAAGALSGKSEWDAFPAASNNEASPFSLPPKLPDSGRRTLLGLKTPQDLGLAPERPQGYRPTLQQFDKEAAERIKSGANQFFPSQQQAKERAKEGSMFHPFQTAGALYNMGAGLVEGSLAPATAAVRNYLTAPIERNIGITAESLESLPGYARGVPEAPVRPAPTWEQTVARTDPTRQANPLGARQAVNAPSAIDMGEFERAIAPQQRSPVDMGALEREITGAPPEVAQPSAVATPRQNLGIRVLNPDVPHNLPPTGRTGTAAQANPLESYPEPILQRARQILAESGLDNPHVLEQKLNEVSPHHTLGELTPGTEEHLGGIHAADQGQAKNLISQTFNQRGAEAPSRMGEAFNRVFGDPQNLAELRRQIENERAKKSSPFWRMFTQTPIPSTPTIERLLPRLDAAGALRAANKAMREEGLPAENTFHSQVPGEYPGEVETEVTHVPTAAAFQYAKEHLDSLIERSLAEPGGANAARRYTQLKNDLLRAVDNHPDQEVAGLWKTARRVWQEPTELMEAQKIGKRLLTGNVDREDIPFLTEGWSPERVAHLKIGMRRYLEDLEKANRSPSRTGNRLMDAILTPGNQEKIRAVIGDRGADELFDAIRHEETMHGAPSRIMYGSPTARRQAARDLYSAQPNQMGQTLGRIAGFIRHPLRAGAAEGVEAAASRASAKQEAEMARLREGLARLFTTQGAERNAVARALIGAEEPAGLATRPEPSFAPRRASAPLRVPVEDHSGDQAEHVRSTVEGLQEHFKNAPAPDDKMSRRVVELAHDEGHTPHEAHEQATKERTDTQPWRRNAGQNEGVSSVPREARGDISATSERTSPSRVPAGANEGRSGSAVPRETPSVPGGVHPGEAERGNGPNQRTVAEDPGERFRRAFQSDPGFLAKMEADQAAENARFQEGFQRRKAEREAETAAKAERQAAEQTPEALQKRALDLAKRRGELERIQLAAINNRSDAEIARMIPSMTIADVRRVREYFGLPAGKGGGPKAFAEGGAVDDDDIARAMTPPPTMWDKWTPEINRKSGEVGDIIGRTGEIMASPIANQAKRMQDVYEHGIDWDDPQRVQDLSGGSLLDMAGLAGGSAAAAERGAVGVFGGKPSAAPWVEKAKELRDQGVRYDEIAERFGVTRGQVAGQLYRAGYTAGERRAESPLADPEIWKKAKQLRAEGMSLGEIADALGGTSKGALGKSFQRPGIKSHEPRMPQLKFLQGAPQEEFTPAELAEFEQIFRARKHGGRIPGDLPPSKKASHQEVNYHSVSPRKKQKCELCWKFIPAVEGGPACRKVASPIAARGWCKRFSLK